MKSQHEAAFQHLRLAAHAALSEVVPKAVEAGAFPAVVSAEVAIELAREDWAPWVGRPTHDVFAHVEALDARARTRLLLGRFLLDLEGAVANLQADGVTWVEAALNLRLEFERLAGYIDGWYRSGADKSKKATAQKLKQGRVSNERVRIAAEPLRKQGLSKNKAAAELAGQRGIGLTEGSLIKKLGKIYPGDTWAWPEHGS